jgi:light-regulated signal transduction histidine kinase (bacteriophytochrome)
MAIDLPFDEVAVLFLALAWVYVIFLLYEEEKDGLIKKLEVKNSELKRTTEELERFTYIASHDLRSPVRNIVSFLGLMERNLKQGKHEDLEECVAYAKSGALKLNQLMQDILELTRVNSNAHSDYKAVDMNDLVEQVCQNLKTEIHDKNAVVTAQPLPKFKCNEVEMSLLVQNLVQNAIKYNQSQQPTTEIWAEEKDGTIHFFVKDNGIGIEPEYDEYIFEMFKRLHSGMEYEGTGLGLALCKRIVKKYGGEISVQSKFGQGSVFKITFPSSLSEAQVIPSAG